MQSLLLCTGWLLVSLLFCVPGSTQALETVRILATTDVSMPIFLTAPVGDERLFVVQRSGEIRIYKDGVLRPTPFLDISDSVNLGPRPFGEGGLLGLVFSENYGESGFFYIYYTSSGSEGNALTSRVSRFNVSSDPNVADSESELNFYSLGQPFGNHNGGTLAIRDGYLYFGLGDGGGSNDPADLGQDNSSVFGQMLRWDIGGVVPASVEAYSYGFRNPFRFSFDRMTGDLYIADVGQRAMEEIDIQSASDHSFRNYGWGVMEGTLCHDPESIEPPCFDASFTEPAWEYAHSGVGCTGSVTGGIVYRGKIDEIYGHYFFADYCKDTIWSFQWDGDAVLPSEVEDRTSELAPAEGGIEEIVAFGEDGLGEMYIVDLGGEVYQVLPEPGVEAVAAALTTLGLLAGRRTRSKCLRRHPRAGGFRAGGKVAARFAVDRH